MATTYQFAHHRIFDGERYLIWGNGIGEVLVPVTSPKYVEALGDRSWQHNDLLDEGETDILSVYFRATTAPATFYGRLYTGSALAETDTLTTISAREQAVSSVGYPGSVSWTRGTTDFGVISDVGGTPTKKQTLTTTKTWTATGTWTTSLTQFVLATIQTTTSGLLIATSALGAARSLVNTDTLDVSVAITLT